MKIETMTTADLSNLRTLVSFAGRFLQTGSKVDSEWLAMRDDLYAKLGRIRDKQAKALP